MTERRSFAGGQDIAKLQKLTARATERFGRVGLMHPGDIPHRIYNGLRRDDPAELVHLWVEGDEIQAWVILDPHTGWLDPQIDPAARVTHPHLEREVNMWSEATLLRLMSERGSTAEKIETDAFEDDPTRIRLLEELGWRSGQSAIVLTRRSVADIDGPQLPPGYRIRTAHGVEEAGPISELHTAAFGSWWTPELYARVMTSPGYHPDRELLIEAPDGRLAAFCVIWPDEINRIGYFEPVGVHPDHRRVGLGSTLMRSGLLEMREWGMRQAEVMYEENNPASSALYLGEGFVPVARIVDYEKPVGEGGRS